jgi:hypothetical protein
MCLYPNKPLNRVYHRGYSPLSGGAAGVDTIAWGWAIDNGVEIIVIKPDYNKHGRGAPLRRNDIIIEKADKILAFWDGKSHGTKYVIEKAKKLNKEVEIIIITDNKESPPLCAKLDPQFSGLFS